MYTVLTLELQVIIDSQPLTVAILAALFFGESIGFLGAAGLVLGVIGLLLLEVNPSSSFFPKTSLMNDEERKFMARLMGCFFP